LADLMVDKAPVFPSKGEMRKLVQNNGFSVNKVKITDPNATLTEDMLLGGKYVLVQKGKKNYVLLIGA
ncbi:MAG: tyrosine--tRNA ligase, partial [Paludibacteraceae bacterium]|nr:tyrosine--tRNA ligase [Paludibacteraceae bacterium]